MRFAQLFALLLSALTLRAHADADVSSRLQYQFFHTRFDNAAPMALLGNRRSRDHFLDARLMAQSSQPDRLWGVHAQLQAIHSETLRFTAMLPSSQAVGAGLIDDRRRLFDLTRLFDEESDTLYQLRLDRLYIGQTFSQLSWRAGRMAVSWGHGLVFHPFDIFNPFDPLAIDREYKPGDDMLYAQWLLTSGDDIQIIALPRREPVSGQLRADESSVALKWHTYLGLTDIELLVARHYNDTIVGAGVAADFNGVLWQGDITYTRGASSSFVSLVSNLAYSWSSFNRPVSGFIEYFFSGAGLHENNGYALADLQADTALRDRLSRGELFTLARHYIAPGLDFELHPLLHVMPTVIWNLDDGSSLLQLLLNWSVSQNMTLVSGFTLARGDSGSEYGATDPARASSQFGNDSFYLRFSTYF